MTSTNTKPMSQDRSTIDQLLRDSKVITSAELIEHLGRSGVRADNARQIIRRQARSEGVWRSEKLRLANNERLFANASKLTSPDFLFAVSEKLSKTKRKGLARCVAALSRAHVLHKVDVMRLLAVSPATPGGRDLKRLYEGELDGLKELGVRVIHEGTALECLLSPAIPNEEDFDQLAAIAAERLRNSAVLTRVLADRLRRQNMMSWNRIEFPDPQVAFTTFNDQVFSAFGFSYLAPLTRWKEGQSAPIPCPVLFDCYQGDCTLADVQSFVQRIERATIRKKSRLASLGVIAARDFARDAWDLARKQGFLTANFRQLFGEEALEAMILVEKLSHGLTTDAKAESLDRFKSFKDLIDDLKTNPIVVALRSIGFEALCGLILRSHGYEQVEMGRVVPWHGTSRDVDVFGMRGEELRVIECKAYHRRKSVPGEEVRKFFTQTLSALKAWLRKSGRSFSSCTAEIWTTGPLGNEARDALYELKRPTGDEWSMSRAEDLKKQIPSAIRARSLELLRTIAVCESEGRVSAQLEPRQTQTGH